MQLIEGFFKVSALAGRPDAIERRIKELEALRAQRKVGSYLSVIDTGVLKALNIQKEEFTQESEIKATV